MLKKLLSFFIAEENVVVQERDIAERKLLDSWTFISIPTQDSFEEYLRHNKMQVGH